MKPQPTSSPLPFVAHGACTEHSGFQGSRKQEEYAYPVTLFINRPQLRLAATALPSTQLTAGAVINLP